MSKIDDGGPAFPNDKNLASMDPLTGAVTCLSDGMSLRDWFAGQALIGLGFALSNAEGARLMRGEMKGLNPHHVLAVTAYKIADAMIAARKGETP